VNPVTMDSSSKGKLACVHTSYGQCEASVMKSHLEAEGIPVLLKYDSASQVFGITVDGLGKVHLMVPEGLAEEARDILRAGTEEQGAERS
jgi:hypothetical protein